MVSLYLSNHQCHISPATKETVGRISVCIHNNKEQSKFVLDRQLNGEFDLCSASADLCAYRLIVKDGACLFHPVQLRKNSPVDATHQHCGFKLRIKAAPILHVCTTVTLI